MRAFIKANVRRPHSKLTNIAKTMM